MIKGFKTQIYPNKEQQEKIIRFCNASRFAYNWAIAIEQDNYKNGGKFISGYNLTKMFTQFKKQEGNEWLKEISGRALKVAILNAGQSYENFFKGRAKYPNFKSKKRSKKSCATHEGTTIIEKKRIRCEKLGWIPSHKHNIPIGENIKYYNHKLSFDGINFWFSVSVELEDYKNTKPKTESVGIDLGIKTLATCSNGIICKKPNIKKEQKKLKRLKKRASKRYQKMIDYSKQTKIKFVKLEKSKNLLKLEKQILKQYQKINNKLTTNIHTFTKSLINLNPQAIVIEDLDVNGMRKNRHLSKSINEAKFYETRRQLVYKCNWYGINLVIADRWYPSSKTCSNCGCIKEKLSLSERIYVCEDCGLIIDRDLNASINLRNLAM
ncbi:RNA-guided endonuclease InsQ/TnpB family protein [Anaerovorax sp. IOR16]|uniref:RNA-guided endonuclease InsQ/TnpB family protein n=1 Tax=Anaerovorax sp. IOR16 TaxID=2773458 RepID=UPI0019D26E19|nr:RNA-guided endonuclease TnpB family protein [Anaerovorax sp. IOR16]